MNNSAILYHLPCVFFSHIESIDMIDDVTKDLDHCYGNLVCMEIKALGLQSLKSSEQKAIAYYTSLESSYNTKYNYLTGATTAIQSIVDGWATYENFKIGTNTNAASKHMEELVDAAVTAKTISFDDGEDLKKQVQTALASTYWTSNTYADLESSLKNDIVSKTIKKESISTKEKEANQMGDYLKAEYKGLKK